MARSRCDALAARRAHVVAAVVAVGGHHPDEVDLAVGPAAQGLVGDRRHRRAGAGVAGWPIIWRRAGRANSSNDTIDDTGLPGRPNTGLPADHAEGQRLGRLDRHLPPVHAPDAGRARPSRSRSRPRSPRREVTSASHVGQPRPRARRGWRPRRRRAVPRSTGSQPASAHQGQQRGPVGVADLARPQRRRRPRPARRRWTARRPGPAGTPCTSLEPEAGQHAEVAGREHGAGLEHASGRRARSSPGRRTWSPAAAATSIVTTPSPSGDGPLDHHDGVGARRASARRS